MFWRLKTLPVSHHVRLGWRVVFSHHVRLGWRVVTYTHCCWHRFCRLVAVISSWCEWCIRTREVAQGPDSLATARHWTYWQVGSHWGRLTLRSVHQYWGLFTLRSVDTEVGSHWGRLTLRSVHIEVCSHWGRLTLRSVHIEVGSHWGRLTLRSVHIQVSLR